VDDSNYFEALADRAEADLQARITLARWQLRKELGDKLKAEPSALRQLQPETETPAEVGMHELASDEYSPAELVALFSDEPHVFDWDDSECTTLEALAEAC